MSVAVLLRGGYSRLRAVSLFVLAPSVTRVVICVSRSFFSTDPEKRETARSLRLQYTAQATRLTLSLIASVLE